MINRVILFKFNDQADATVMERIQGYVARIGSELDEPLAYHFSRNKAAGTDDYDWVLHSSFETEEAMNAYRIAPLHQEFVGYCDPYTEDFKVIFYQAPAA